MPPKVREAYVHPTFDDSKHFTAILMTKYKARNTTDKLDNLIPKKKGTNRTRDLNKGVSTSDDTFCLVDDTISQVAVKLYRRTQKFMEEMIQVADKTQIKNYELKVETVDRIFEHKDYYFDPAHKRILQDDVMSLFTDMTNSHSAVAEMRKNRGGVSDEDESHASAPVSRSATPVPVEERAKTPTASIVALRSGTPALVGLNEDEEGIASLASSGTPKDKHINPASPGLLKSKGIVGKLTNEDKKEVEHAKNLCYERQKEVVKRIMANESITLKERRERAETAVREIILEFEMTFGGEASTASIKHLVAEPMRQHIIDDVKVKTPDVKPVVKEEVKPVVKEEVKPVVKEEVKPVVKEEIKPVEVKIISPPLDISLMSEYEKRDPASAMNPKLMYYASLKKGYCDDNNNGAYKNIVANKMTRMCNPINAYQSRATQTITGRFEQPKFSDYSKFFI